MAAKSFDRDRGIGCRAGGLCRGNPGAHSLGHERLPSLSAKISVVSV